MPAAMGSNAEVIPAARPPMPIRSLADELRSWSAQSLRRLLELRPDLLTPPVSDLSTIATRAAQRPSILLSIDSLDAFSLQVLEALVITAKEPIKPGTLERLLDCPMTELRQPLATIAERALTWGPPDALRVVGAVRDALGPYPAGLGPPLRAAHALIDPATLTARVDQAPGPARAVLTALAAGPPIGAIRAPDRGASSASASAIDWLLSQGLVQPADEQHVLLPREVGLYLRGGRSHLELTPKTPEITFQPVPRGTDPARTFAAAAGAGAQEFLRLVHDLGEHWSAHPPAVLRGGGLSARDFKVACTTLETTELNASIVVEVAKAAGLIAVDAQSPAQWAPTEDYDRWLADSPGHRWATLATAWLYLNRAPELAGSKSDRGVRAALGPELSQPSAVRVRAAVLAELATVPPGQAATPESLLARLKWRYPRQTGSGYAATLWAIIAQAELLGVTGYGALSDPGRGLLAQPPEQAQLAESMASILPPSVDQILVQADLTAVAPGPLAGPVDQLMRLAARVESRGGATVYRFAPDTLHRALASGLSAPELIDQLQRYSRTELPQGLTYLITDLARQHGQIRLGVAGCYLRSEDESLLRELVNNSRLSSLGLRSLAPTVLISARDPATALRAVREIGLSPATETDSGAIVVHRPRSHRAPTTGSLPSTTPSSNLARPTRAAIDAVLAQARANLGSASPEGDASSGTKIE